MSRLALPALIAALTLTSSAQASELSLAQRYVRMRAADAAGDATTANAEVSALLAREPFSQTIAIRAYRQAIASGDFALGLKAGKLLDGQQALPPDGPLLFAIDAVRRRDWAAARANVDRLERGRLFAFLAPALRAWIALEAHDADPLALIEAARSDGIASAYYPPQRALLLLALHRTDEGVAAIQGMAGAGVRLKLIAASALLRQNARAKAEALLAGDDDTLAAARARLARSGRLSLDVEGAGAGISELLTQVSLDFNRQQLGPVALVMARLATDAAPGNGSAWIATGNFLGQTHRPEAALAALGHVAADDPFAPAAETLRLSLLIDQGQRDRALGEVLASAKRPEAGAAQWGRVGDVYLAADRPADAAEAYRKAIDSAPPPGDLWTLWLQRGSALELAGDWAAAKAALLKAYALAPEEPVVLNHLGYSELSRRENVGQATKMIEQASRLRPDDPAITDSLGWAHFLQGDLVRALPLLERAASADPAEPTINEHLGDVYWTAGRRLEARYSWRAALVTAEAKDAERIRTKIDAGLTRATAAP